MEKIADNISIRPYKPEDATRVLHLLRLNTPAYFAHEEEKDLADYLAHEREEYYVIECDGLLVGSGGINFAENGTVGRISWDILHPDYQGRSLGTQLLQYRVRRLCATAGVRKITVRTSQLAYKFYSKQGFQLIGIVKDFWAPGFDMYFMEYKNHSDDPTFAAN